jgi:hypothetical protein
VGSNPTLSATLGTTIVFKADMDGDMNADQIQRQVNYSLAVALVCALLAVAGYLLHFFGADVSADPAAWGQAGDFFGGLLNPLFAFLAFYWLTRSVLLQKQELSETKEELRKSAESQRKQEENYSKTVVVSALGSYISSINDEIGHLSSQISYMIDQAEPRGVIRTLDGDAIDASGRLAAIAALKSQVAALRRDRQIAVDKIREYIGFDLAADDGSSMQ